MSVNLRAYKPNEVLIPFVEIFWAGHFNEQAQKLFLQKIIPNGFIELIIHLSDWHCDLLKERRWSQSPDFTIIGLHHKPYEVQFTNNVKVFAIRFKPEGIQQLFGIPASELKEKYEDTSLVLGQEFRSFCDQIKEVSSFLKMVELAEKYLMQRAEKNQVKSNYINFAAELIRNSKGKIKIEDLADQACISIRQLERVFKQQIGQSPKQYQRISRIHAIHSLLEIHQQMNFAELAYHSGYTDQAHFIRDFINITGEKPTVFVREKDHYNIILRPR